MLLLKQIAQKNGQTESIPVIPARPADLVFLSYLAERR
jgi:hypothetical protein